MSAIVCRDVTRRFGELTAVDGVSFTVEDNEIFGIIGPNGQERPRSSAVLKGWTPQHPALSTSWECTP